MEKSYHSIYKYYESKLAQHGANHLGVDWPKQEDLNVRFNIMTSLTKILKNEEKFSLLDLGCGVGLFVDYLKKTDKYKSVNYFGVDISSEMIKQAMQLHPKDSFEVRDILTTPIQDSSYEFVIMNGLLTEKVTLTQDDMIEFAQKIITAAFNICSKGICFNVMSSHVDWTRDDLFHWPLDDLMSFLVKDVSRHVVIRSDYGLYEYSVYIYKNSNQ
jgi:SAM-dependent methyltransferase